MFDFVFHTTEYWIANYAISLHSSITSHKFYWCPSPLFTGLTENIRKTKNDFCRLKAFSIRISGSLAKQTGCRSLLNFIIAKWIIFYIIINKLKDNLLWRRLTGRYCWNEYVRFCQYFMKKFAINLQNFTYLRETAAWCEN